MGTHSTVASSTPLLLDRVRNYDPKTKKNISSFLIILDDFIRRQPIDDFLKNKFNTCFSSSIDLIFNDKEYNASLYNELDKSALRYILSMCKSLSENPLFLVKLSLENKNDDEYIEKELNDIIKGTIYFFRDTFY